MHFSMSEVRLEGFRMDIPGATSGRNSSWNQAKSCSVYVHEQVKLISSFSPVLRAGQGLATRIFALAVGETSPLAAGQVRK